MSLTLGMSAFLGFKVSLCGIRMWRAVVQGLLLGSDENWKTTNSITNCILKHTPISTDEDRIHSLSKKLLFAAVGNHCRNPLLVKMQRKAH